MTRLAASSDDVEALDALLAELPLERGADPRWVGHDDLTPAAAAQRSGAHELGAWLRERATA